MIIDIKKLERQQVGVDKWFNSSMHGSTKDRQGTLHWFTGVGKTYAAILIIKRLFRMYPKHNVVILVPSEILYYQWKVELGGQFTKKELERIEVLTSHQVANNKIKITTDTLIVDELHEYLSEELVKTINGKYIRSTNRLGLTATYKDSKNRQKAIEIFFPIIDEISEQEAIEEGYISPYVEFNLSVKLTEEERTQYQRYTDVISKNINKFGNNGLDLATKCLGGGKHSDGKKYDNKHFVYAWAMKQGWRTNLNLDDPRDREINDIWNPYLIFGYAQNLLNAIRLRKDVLYSAQNKYQLCMNIVHKFSDFKSIVFSQSTSFADKINLLINEDMNIPSVVYHSKLETVMLPSTITGKLIKFGKTRLKRQAIDAIKTGKANVICTASSLDKGFDVQDVNLGITASGTSNFTQYKQRGGRVKRKDMFNSKKCALLVNLYVEDSQEEVWLKKRQSESSHYIHFVDSVDEISLTPIRKGGININDI